MPELPVRPPVNPLDAGPTGVSFTLAELADASGLTAGDLEELDRYGLLVGHSVAGDTFYDGDALIVARTAAASCASGSRPATCACTRSPPSARRGSWSRW